MYPELVERAEGFLHGLRLEAGPAEPGQGRPGQAATTLHIEYSDQPIVPAGPPAWEHREQGRNFSSRFALYPHPQGWLVEIDCEGRGAFLVGADFIRVHWHGGTDPAHYLQTIGMAVYLELRGTRCLHANTLARDGSAIGLLAPSRTGKSTLSAALAGAGWTLLTDDMAALHRAGGDWQVYPSAAQTRLWPDAGAHFHGAAYSTSARVHARFDKRLVQLAQPRQAQRQPAPLRALYLLERRAGHEGPIEINPLSGPEAVLALVRNSIVGDAAAALGIERKRLADLAAVAAELPVRRLSYPSGFGRLDAIAAALEEDSQRAH